MPGASLVRGHGDTFKLTAIRPIQALHYLTSPKLLAIASLTTPPDTGLADKHHVVSIHYLDDGDNNALFFLVPIVLVVGLSYLFLRLDLFVVQLAVMSLSFRGHYYLDNQYHVAGSWLGGFSWFRRKQQLHFIHHRHGNCNFAVIDFFWDRFLGTNRRAESGGCPVTSVASPRPQPTET